MMTNGFIVALQSKSFNLFTAKLASLLNVKRSGVP